VGCGGGLLPRRRQEDYMVWPTWQLGK
jgi:hypothetical protein